MQIVIIVVDTLFLSTLSLRRATHTAPKGGDNKGISIHALLAESDESQPLCARPTRDFYPRSPCGERLQNNNTGFDKLVFLSTLSLRRATSLMLYDTSSLIFLSTLSLRRATRKSDDMY